MKLQKRVLSFLIAFMAVLSFANIPNIVNGIAKAATGLDVASVVLQVKDVTDEFDLTNEHNTIVYKDYCTTSGAEVILWNPDGSEITTGYIAFSSGASYTFERAGVYAIQYRLLTNGFYIYSDIIYIPVANSVAAITFENELESVVKAGTVVAIPAAKETGVSVKVYDPFGEEVEISANSFTNNPKILGSYYIEYSKTVSYGGESVIQYAYKVIEFSQNSSITNATITKAEEDSVGEYKLVVETTDLYKEKEYLYQYKYYDLTDAYVLKPDGTKDDAAVIYVTIYDEKDKTYYNFASGEFVASTASEMKKNIKDISSDFILKNLTHFESVDSKGHAIKITYTSDAGNGLEVSFSRTEKFNDNAITAKTQRLNASELTNKVDTNIIIDKNIPTNDADLKPEQIAKKSVEFSAVNLVVEEGYDEAGLLALLKSVNFGATHSLSSKAYTSSAGEDAVTGFGVKTNKGLDQESPIDDSFTLFYNVNAKSEYHFVCAYSINFEGASTNFQFSKRIEWKMFVREESGDVTKPYDISIGTYFNVVNGESFVIPSISATDLDDSGTKTSGVDYRAVISGSLGSSYEMPQEVIPGSELANLKQGTYKITYSITDFAKNTRVVEISIKVVKDNAFTTFDNISIPFAEVEEVEGIKNITVNSNAEYAYVYTQDGKAFTPNLEYLNGGIKLAKIDIEDGVNAVLVLANRNYFGTTYSGVRIRGSVTSILPNSFSVASLSSSYTTIRPNASNKVKVNDKTIWFGNKNFEIEVPENGLYRITDANEIVFMEAGTYTIKSIEELGGNEYPSTTTVVVSSNYTTFSYEMPVGNKMIAKKGNEIEIRKPIVVNYFGYSLEIYVEDAKGNHIVVTDENLPESFIASNVENYKINYKILSDDVSASVKTIVVSTGKSTAPTITIAGVNENMLWTGENIKYVIQGATAIDKYGESSIVDVYCYDPAGREVEVKIDGNGSCYVDVKDAGVYNIYYTSVDPDGVEAISKSSFVIEFPEVEEETKTSPWKVIGIIFGSIAASGVIALIVLFVIKQDKKKKKFINKNKATKRKEKVAAVAGLKLFTIAESKDEKHWVIKQSNRVVGKCDSKVEAIEKVKSIDKNGEAIIKVYNKNGRLIDSI